PVAGEAPLVVRRRYQPTHNIGYFRYLECGRLDAYGQPQGDITPWTEIQFPFDPALQLVDGLKRLPVTRGHNFNNLVEEVYTCDANGIIEVEISDLTNEFSQRFRLRGKGTTSRTKNKTGEKGMEARG
ncbi:MAG TPA: hypothetical protein VEF04_02180, partial [Blastocatellia bacterium]|nr:hypothetical protein [Blastocatellia bacterium]